MPPWAKNLIFNKGQLGVFRIVMNNPARFRFSNSSSMCQGCKSLKPKCYTSFWNQLVYTYSSLLCAAAISSTAINTACGIYQVRDKFVPGTRWQQWLRAIYIVIGSNERMIRRDHVKLHTFAPGIIQDEHWRGTRPFLFLFSMSFIILALLFSLSLLRIVVAQIRGHIAGSSPPLPTTVRALLFCRKKISTLLSSLVDSHRSVPVSYTHLRAH